ncbi:MAG: hypothetical protein IID41_02630 [Planctomycetes bacterium]|nr:hypothetical protein [Planctomycetota bacterium]
MDVPPECVRHCENCGVRFNFGTIGWNTLRGRMSHYACSARCAAILDSGWHREGSPLDLQMLETLREVVKMFEPRPGLPDDIANDFRRMIETHPMLIKVRAAIVRVEAARAGPSYGVPPAASVVSNA